VYIPGEEDQDEESLDGKHQDEDKENEEMIQNKCISLMKRIRMKKALMENIKKKIKKI